MNDATSRIVAGVGPTHVAHLTINRPECGNAMSVAMIQEFLRQLTVIEHDDNVKIIVVSGAGPDLCAGLDPDQVGVLHTHLEGVPVDKVPSLRARLATMDTLFWGSNGLYTRVLKSPKVTVLAAKGRCHDVGLHLALCCDIVVADETASFGNPRWQHVGVDGDVSMLISTVGRKRASELMFAGRLWSANEALTHGLISQVASPGEAERGASEIAQIISGVIRDGIAAEKYLTLASLEKLGIGAGHATATVAGAMASLIHFRDGEFNFLKAKRDLGLEAALTQAADAKRA